MDDYHLATAILGAFSPSSASQGPGLDNAIRVELLVTALQHNEHPRTLSSLLRVLERVSAGEVAEELLRVVRERAEQEPHLLLTDLAGRAA